MTSPAVGRNLVEYAPQKQCLKNTWMEANMARRCPWVKDHRFDWSHHITIMANRARSTAHTLHILGNSVCGLDYANWCRIFHALILPVLTYGFPVYSTQPHIKGLLETLQVAQNILVHKMSSCFKTMPVTPLHYLMAIPPIANTIKKLTSTFTLRLQCLPPSTLLHTLLHHNPSTNWHPSLCPPTALTRILPNSFPPFYFPSHPSTPSWSYPRVCDNTIIKINCKTQDSTKLLISQPGHNTFH